MLARRDRRGLRPGSRGSATLPSTGRAAELDLASRLPRSSPPTPLVEPECAPGAGPRDAHLSGQARLAEEDARGPGLSPARRAARPAPPPTFPGETAASDRKDEVSCLSRFLSGAFGHRRSLRPEDGCARVRVHAGPNRRSGSRAGGPGARAQAAVKPSGILLGSVTFANARLPARRGRTLPDSPPTLLPQNKRIVDVLLQAPGHGFCLVAVRQEAARPLRA